MVKRLEATVNTLSNDVEELKKNNKHQNLKIDEMGKITKQQDKDKRKANIIIEGLTEVKTEHPRQQVAKLLQEIGVNVPMESMLTISRLGPVTSTNSRRPRHILVKFVSPFWKQEVFRNINKAKDSQKWSGVHVQDDLPQEIIEQRRDLRCLTALAKERGHRVALRGVSLVVDDQRFAFYDIGNLPDGSTLENAKLVQVEDGWVFQGHHAFPSSMYPCTIKYKGQDFHCAEHAYVHDMAEEANDQHAIKKLRDCKNGYEAKRIGKKRKKKLEMGQHQA